MAESASTEYLSQQIIRRNKSDVWLWSPHVANDIDVQCEMPEDGKRITVIGQTRRRSPSTTTRPEAKGHRG